MKATKVRAHRNLIANSRPSLPGVLGFEGSSLRRRLEAPRGQKGVPGLLWPLELQRPPLYQAHSSACVPHLRSACMVSLARPSGAKVSRRTPWGERLRSQPHWLLQGIKVISAAIGKAQAGLWRTPEGRAFMQRVSPIVLYRPSASQPRHKRRFPPQKKGLSLNRRAWRRRRCQAS